MAYELMKKIPRWIKRTLTKLMDDDQNCPVGNEEFKFYVKGRYYKYKLVVKLGETKVYRERLVK